jgi:hypothetical protein
MRSPAGNKSPALAQDAQKSVPPSRSSHKWQIAPHTDPEPRYTGIGAGALPRAPRTHPMPHAHVAHAIHGLSAPGAPLSRARTRKATRRGIRARRSHQNAHRAPKRTRKHGTGTCHGWAVQCMPGQCKHKAGWQTQHPSPSMNAVSCSRMCCAALNPCLRGS